MNYNKNSKVKRRNVGLELLRALLCFWVIIFHFLISTNNIASSVKRKRYHVPCFFFISFFYLYPAIKDKNIAKMKLRLQRLLIPYLIWPFIIFIINNALFLLFKNIFIRFENSIIIRKKIYEPSLVYVSLIIL